MFGVALSDATYAWAVGLGGSMVSTSHGGATWKEQRSGSTEALNGVAFADPTHGWAAGEADTIIANRAAPRIAGFTPSSGPVGTAVAVTGANVTVASWLGG
jgi:photosystem II stability/assembly factor-like uncharacterized protein